MFPTTFFQEGLNIVENRTADIIQETRKLQIRKERSSSENQNRLSNVGGARQQPPKQTHMQPQMQTDLEIQLKASRDVRWQLCITCLNTYLGCVSCHFLLQWISMLELNPPRGSFTQH